MAERNYPTPDGARLTSDPTAWLDAHGEMSATLRCGCRWPPSAPSRVRMLVNAGHRADCPRHGPTFIIRATFRLIDHRGSLVEPLPPSTPSTSTTIQEG